MAATLMNTLSAFFAGREDIRLAVVFGSIARGDARLESDVDIAVEWVQRPSLLELGGLANELEAIAGRRIDLVELTDLAAREPYFAFRIAAEGKPLYAKMSASFSAFKTDAYIRYFDIKDFLDRQAALLSKRIANDHFARARHA